MSAALALARQGLGRTSPNPSVGALLVRDGQVLGEGWTQPPGGPHAEIVALNAARQAGHDVRGTTMYVTLEPCCHHGKTPPCTDAILAAGVTRVVAGMEDPFPPMQGKGLEILRGAGVEVALGVMGRECAAMNQGFTRAIVHGIPAVTCKAGISADGRIATARGESQWITGELSRAHAHHQRAEHDAILVGIGTVLADNPRLTCRVRESANPVPVVLDSGLRIPEDAALLHGPRRAIVFTAVDAPERAIPAEVIRVPRGEGGIHLESALQALVARGLHRVLVEGGGRVHRCFLDARLVDELLLYVGNLAIPGGIPWLGGPPIDRLSSAIELGKPEFERIGDEVLMRWRPPHRLEVPCSPA